MVKVGRGGQQLICWVVALAVAALAHAWPVVALAGVGWPVVYVGSLWPLPGWPCERCGGSNTHRVPVLSALTGGVGFGCRSRWCNGRVRIRLGVRVLTPARARALMGVPL